MRERETTKEWISPQGRIHREPYGYCITCEDPGETQAEPQVCVPNGESQEISLCRGCLERMLALFEDADLQAPTAGAVLASLTGLERWLDEHGCICTHPDRERCTVMGKAECVCSCHGRLEYAAQEASDERA